MFKNCRTVLQVVGGVMTLSLPVGSQAPQHLGSSGGQSTCGSCFGCQSNWLVVFFDASESRTVEPQESWKTGVRHATCQSLPPIPQHTFEQNACTVAVLKMPVLKKIIHSVSSSSGDFFFFFKSLFLVTNFHVPNRLEVLCLLGFFE